MKIACRSSGSPKKRWTGAEMLEEEDEGATLVHFSPSLSVIICKPVVDLLTWDSPLLHPAVPVFDFVLAAVKEVTPRHGGVEKHKTCVSYL